jgi:hypothetical protein
MKRVGFVGCEAWLKHTGSADFFVKLLKNDFEVKTFSEPKWVMKGNAPINELNKAKLDAIVFWYILPPARYLAKLECKNIIWVPMWDGQNGLLLSIIKSVFYKAFNLKVICFSKKCRDLLSPFFNCRYYQYFPKPLKQVKLDKPRLLFWERRENLNYHFISKNLINENDFDSITVKQTIDIGTSSKIINPKIKVINKWLAKREYEKVLSKHNVFIAPRLKEGIGFSFLEALQRGYCVIANNDSTMNEYIKDNETGIFNYSKPENLNINKELIKRIGTNTSQFMKKGYLKWNKQKRDLLKWILN